MGFFSAIGSFIMTPLYYVISAIMVGWHELFTALGLPADSGAAWALSIVGLTLVIRMLLIPLFVKQIKSSRNMQLIQPKVKELQKKYGHDRERLAQETMKLYRETGTNPFASCLPILLQMPIFFGLFRLIDQAAKNGEGRGVLTDEQAQQFQAARLFGVDISETFISAGGDVGVMLMAAALVVAMTVTTFLTQRQLMSKNMPADALSGPYAQQQKLLLYVLPLVFAVGGVAFPIGVLIYWTTSNLWTMGQQFYVIRRNPAPGTPAATAKAERDKARAARKGLGPTPEEQAQEAAAAAEAEAAARRAAARQQPKRQTRSQRTAGGRPAQRGAGPGGATTGGSTKAGAKPATKASKKKR
ncbi:membrane protein insertase YidC [Nocardioides perillae]|uniref:Membrane protein insertase YidC n=1 Tax=Nocardioides perillae TaxID=1119534 RepID=A0A7Y9URA0_9ACTN|nr:YidC/Oxa1 family membrane protein insertase [Nocardioides perillae]